jgi:hypothetical protein
MVSYDVLATCVFLVEKMVRYSNLADLQEQVAKLAKVVCLG